MQLPLFPEGQGSRCVCSCERIDHNLKHTNFKSVAYHSNKLHSFDSLSKIIAGGRYDDAQFTSDTDSSVIFYTSPSPYADIGLPTNRRGHGLLRMPTFAISGHLLVDTEADAWEKPGEVSAMVVVVCCVLWLLCQKYKENISAARL